MSISEKLTYFEHMLLKKVWPAHIAVGIIVDVYLLSRGWKGEEVLETVAGSYREQLTLKLALEDINTVFVNKSFTIAGWDNNHNWVEGQLILEDSTVDPRKYIDWLHVNGYHMPYEFKEFIGVEAKEEPLTPKAELRIDKAVCQGIARTLWDTDPGMTIEDMQFHKAIQVYGGGRLYQGEGTLRGWLRIVDPREKKRGPKRKA